MAHLTISEEDLLDGALDLFRTAGFVGVSLNDLSKATGLEKASLYYRYPNGKEEIAMAALQRVIDWFEENVFAPLRTDSAPRKRVAIVADKLREFYGNGTKSCVTDVLSLPSGGEQITATLQIAIQAWLKAFTDIARESGLSTNQARLRAEEALIDIQGSLVLSRALRNTSMFQRVLKRLPDLLTKADGR